MLAGKSGRIMILLHHAAIATADYEQSKRLFEKIGMHIERETGSVPNRQLWFREGIQLKESQNVSRGSNIDHLALKTDQKESLVQIILENGCTPEARGDNWFSLPNGTLIELI